MALRQETDLEFRETQDYQSMKRLALEAGLEDGTYSDFVIAFGFYDRDSLVACGAVKEQKGVYSIECLAVREGFRGRGLGRRLVESLEKDATKRGAAKMWAVARAPDFFERIGYTKVSSENSEGPTLSGCMSCRQYQHGCNPSIVVKVLRESLTSRA
jgi:amino-acid N-acetyltransferase